jgi:hypothetical protein
MTLYIGLPCYGGMLTMRCAKSIIGLMLMKQSQGQQVNILFQEGESLIQRARNQVVHQFLKHSKNEDDRLLFIDADLEFQPEWVPMLESTGYDLVGLAYPRKRMEWEDMANSPDPERDGASYFIAPEIGDEGKAITVENGCVPVRWLGTGFMMISRKALEKMVLKYPETAHISDTYGSQGEVVHALFDCIIDPHDGIYLSEDYTFCKRWREAGGRVWMGIFGSPSHIGNHVFKGNLDKLLTRKEQ